MVIHKGLFQQPVSAGHLCVPKPFAPDNILPHSEHITSSVRRRINAHCGPKGVISANHISQGNAITVEIIVPTINSYGHILQYSFFSLSFISLPEWCGGFIKRFILFGAIYWCKNSLKRRKLWRMWSPRFIVFLSRLTLKSFSSIETFVMKLMNWITKPI